jgi:hypothetical protein
MKLSLFKIKSCNLVFYLNVNLKKAVDNIIYLPLIGSIVINLGYTNSLRTSARLRFASAL